MSESPKKKMRFSQNKGKYYSKPPNQHHQYLAPGMKGFLATCNFREKDCVREAYNILREAADELYGPEESEADKQIVEAENTTTAEINEASDDIADQLQKEVNAVKTDKRKLKYHRFQRVETAANNCVFIQTTLDNPVEVAARIVEEIKSSGQQKTRFLLRLIPIEIVCRIEDMESAAGKLFDCHFLKKSSTFSIVFNKRYNNGVHRDKIINQLAELVQSKNDANRVDLKNPEKAVVVEIVKGLCLLSVVPGYVQNKKYNLVELACSGKGETVQCIQKEVDQQEELPKTEIESKNQEEGNNDEKT